MEKDKEKFEFYIAERPNPPVGGKITDAEKTLKRMGEIIEKNRALMEEEAKNNEARNK